MQHLQAVSRFRRWVGRVACASLAALLVLMSGASGSYAGGSATYRGPAYSSSLPVAATESKQQSKVWFHDGAWWAVMNHEVDDSMRVFELLPDHSWRVTNAVVTDGATSSIDALSDGGALRVLYQGSRNELRLMRLTYDPADRTYVPDEGFPVTVALSGSAAATIDRDETGQLWVTFMHGRHVWVSHSIGDDATWATPFPLPLAEASVSPRDTTAIIAFPGHVGAMWSDQAAGRYLFAVHANGAPADEWVLEIPVAGAEMSDDHINLKAFGTGRQGRVYAAVKTSRTGRLREDDVPLMLVLVRRPDGEWRATPAGVLADDHSRPIVMLDEANEELYVLAQSPGWGGQIYYKRAPLGDLAFPPGRGEPLVGWPGDSVGDVSGSKDPVTIESGLVVLAASEAPGRRYYHSELALAPGKDPAVPQPRTSQLPPPGHLTASVVGAETIKLSWSAPEDDRWHPASAHTPVSGYAVYRDGVRIATSDVPSYTDTAAKPGVEHRYSVDAVDVISGKRSRRSVQVAVTASTEAPREWKAIYGWSILALAAAVTSSLVRRGRPGRL